MRQRVAVLVGLAALAWSSAASAYCYTTTCDGVPICDGPPVEVDGCIPLHWKTGCAGITVFSGGSPKLGLSANTTRVIADLAFDTWKGLDCGGGPPGFQVIDMGEAECELVQYNKDAGNANVIIFRDDAWPNPETDNNIALTTTTFDPDTGELLDADIELNSATYDLTVSDEAVDYDLLSVLTHEGGHFLGLAHSQVSDATMFAVYEGESIDLRTPEEDDVTALCALYPPDPSVDESCNPLPRHGFSPYCRDDQPEGGCAYRPVEDGASTSLGAIVVALGAALVARLNRRRSARPSPSGILAAPRRDRHRPRRARRDETRARRAEARPTDR
ncbi:MAG TPA: matrixin family metalloprotease [Polyangiaceae bacterium]|nr:matrixin family metalloprotease [Polyangiaceae bacterium]